MRTMSEATQDRPPLLGSPIREQRYGAGRPPRVPLLVELAGMPRSRKGCGPYRPTRAWRGRLPRQSATRLRSLQWSEVGP